MPPFTTETDWERAFDEKFKDVWSSKLGTFVPIPGGVRLNMHDFICSLLSSYRSAVLDEAIAKGPKDNESHYECFNEDATLEDVYKDMNHHWRSSLEELKK